MNKKKSLMIILLVFVLLMGGAYALYSGLGDALLPDQLAVQKQHAASAESAQSDGKTTPAQPKVPDFIVYDASGSEVRLSDYFGKPIVLNFWASRCGPCQREMPDFDEKYRELGEEVAFLMVNMTDGSRETVEVASSFVQEKDYAFPVLYDTAAAAATAFGVYSLPTTYFIDSQGQAIARASGTIDAQTLQRGIDMIR